MTTRRSFLSAAAGSIAAATVTVAVPALALREGDELERLIEAHRVALRAFQDVLKTVFNPAERRALDARGTLDEDAEDAALEAAEETVDDHSEAEGQALRRLLLCPTEGDAEARLKARYLLSCKPVMEVADGTDFRRLLLSMARRPRVGKAS